MFKYMIFFTLLSTLFLFSCSGSNVKEESLKTKTVKNCPICPICSKVQKSSKKKRKKRKKTCEPKIVYKSYDKLVIGEIENVYFPKYEIRLRARIDTGAKTTSLHAENITPFERDGERWVRFEILNKNKEVIKVKKQIKRIVKIKGSDGSHERRYVVMMRINISSFTYFGEVNLTDRSSLINPVLVGRNFLKGHAIVDVSQKFTQKPMKEKK